MGIEALRAQYKAGKLTKEQFLEAVKALLDAGTITQEEHDEAIKDDEDEDPDKKYEGLTAAEIRALIESESAKHAQSAADKVRTEYAKKLKDEQDAKDKLLRDKMTAEEQAEFDRKKHELELQQRENDLKKREVQLHVIEKINNAFPLAFKDFLVADTKEDSDAKIELFRATWDAELKKAVDERLKGLGKDRDKPPGGGGTSKKWKEMSLTEQSKLYQSDKEKAIALAKADGVSLS